jgi:hypothetical protein
MADEFAVLATRISALMDVRVNGSSESLLAEMEHTLTDGYARVLALEGERLRIERRIADLARELDADATGELRDLASRLIVADAEESRLRGLLEGLRRQAELLRADSTTPAVEPA